MSTDTAILDITISVLRRHAEEYDPLSPMQCREMVHQIELSRGSRRAQDSREKMAADVLNQAFTGPNMQRLWRCVHHPSAIDNFNAKHALAASDPGAYVGCEHGCNMSELRWWDNGTCTAAK
jgi:hypothetical protein